jgi:ribosomal protein L5
MQVPRLEKICLNQGVKGATSDKKLVDNRRKRNDSYCRSKGSFCKISKFSYL